MLPGLAADALGLGRQGPLGLRRQLHGPGGVGFGGQLAGPLRGKQRRKAFEQVQAGGEVVGVQVIAIHAQHAVADLLQRDPGTVEILGVGDAPQRLAIGRQRLGRAPGGLEDFALVQLGRQGLGCARAEPLQTIELVQSGRPIGQFQETQPGEEHGRSRDPRAAVVGALRVTERLQHKLELLLGLELGLGVAQRGAGQRPRLQKLQMRAEQSDLGGLPGLGRDLPQRGRTAGQVAAGQLNLGPLDQALQPLQQGHFLAGQARRFSARASANLGAGSCSSVLANQK